MGAQRRRKGFGVDQWVGGDLGNKRRERRAEEEGMSVIHHSIIIKFLLQLYRIIINLL